MKDRPLETIVERRNKRPIPLHSLMPGRVRNILLVSSLYDFFTFEEDGELTELLFSEYLELNLRYAPRIERVSTAEEALDKLQSDRFDLVISMLRVGSMDVLDFGRAVKEILPDLPVVLLAYQTRELEILESMGDLPGIDRIFVWHGDVMLFLAIIKYVEDRLNVRHDTQVAGVQCIILIEDSVSFYSTYLPMLYTELVVQTQALMADGLNRTQKLMRMRARPKILLATTYEEGLDLYRRHRDHVLGVIVDARFPKGGKLDPEAGVDFARMVKKETWDRAVLMQSSDAGHEASAASVGAHFVNKNSPTLLNDVRRFMQDYLGFGTFVFRRPDGTVVTVVDDLRTLARALEEVPDESLIYHASRNDFSTWLMARTEFDLAKALRPRKVEEFEGVSDIRRYLVSAFEEHLESAAAGVVAEFSSRTFDESSSFVRIGSGSLGGKGRGLAFINSLLDSFNIEDHIPGVDIFVPPSTVLATEVFDRFMDESGLSSLVFGECEDDEITRAFLAARLPKDVKKALRTYLSRVHYPLAVRSSSLLEDASYQPFAGIYRTYMIPNNHEDPEVRLEELSNAIKLVYASTYYADPKSYIESTPNRLEEEKMAVIIQQVVGRRHGNYLYPDIAGAARSHDYYPMAGMKSEDGVASAALGLGRTVVEGGRCVRFSPAQPRRLYQFSTIEDYLENAQREFIALDLSRPGPDRDAPDDAESNLVTLGLDAANEHGTLAVVGSTYSPENEAVFDGISRPGVRLVTLAGVLKHGVFPLADTLSFLLEMGAAAFSCPVEIEFAVNLRSPSEGPQEFGFLQIRSLVIESQTHELRIDEVDPAQAVCLSRQALGHGLFDDVRDLVYVRRDNFDRSKTVGIAGEIAIINERLKRQNRPYILIGPGRWGTLDRWFGIPVTWSQISGVRCIVETDMKDVNVPPSQGAHFFHNITSFGIGHFTLSSRSDSGTLDYEWLDKQPVESETEHVRHLSFPEPLEIVVDSRSRLGAVMKPGFDVKRRGE